MLPPEPKVVRRDALTDRVYELIKERIIDQAYPPSARLRAEEIASALGVSATPVREALNRLSSERLVVSEPHRGFAVTPELDPQGYADLFDACVLLQVQAGELGAPTVTDAEVADMEQAIAGADQACRQGGYEVFRAFTTYDRAFHTYIMIVSRNPFLADLWEQLNPYAQLARLYNRAILTGAISGTYSTAEHLAILDAYRARDGALASRLLHRHMENSKQRWVTFAQGLNLATRNGRFSIT